MTAKDHRLIGLLQRAVYLQSQQWTVMGLIESYITNNNGLTDAQTEAAYEAVRNLASAGDNDTITQEEADLFMQSVAKMGTIERKPAITVAPMSYDEFAQKYSDAYTSAGDEVPMDITDAYAVYCQDPAGHFLHKEKP